MRAALALFGIVAVIALFFFFGYTGFKNTAISLDQQIQAQEKINQTVLDTYWKQVTEAAQVTDLQAKHYKEIYTGLIQGRYNDPQLLFKSIKEDNPKLEPGIYTKLMTIVEAGRLRFANEQKKLIDLVREFNTHIQTFPGSLYNGIAGYLSKEAKIVTSDRTNDAFSTGKEQPINILGK